MSVVGIGTDIIDISRIDAMSDKVRGNLAKRVLTLAELGLYQQHHNPIAFLAKRWAAKEAAAKALGTGIAAGVSFQHIEIQSLASGQPILEFSEQALTIAQQKGATSWHISLADEKKYATAFVVLSA